MSTPLNSVTDFSKMLEQFKLPGFDMTSLTEAQRKNIDALTHANQLAFEGMQALVKKQTEIFSARMQEIQAALQKMSGADPKDIMTQQGEFVQQSMSKALEDMRELAEMAQKSQTEALAAISKRVA